MLNIKNTIRQMRVQRRLGNLSLETQVRTLRRLGHAPVVARAAQVESHIAALVPEWNGMMGLLQSINAEVEPVLVEQRKVERECYDVKYAPEAESRTVKLNKVTVKVARQPLEGYEYTRAWWDEAAKKERAAAKAERLELVED